METSTDRINRIIHSFLGDALEFTSVEPVDGRIAEPIEVDGLCLGYLIAKAMDEETHARLRNIAELLILVLKYGAEADEHVANLDLLERNLDFDSESANVVPFRQRSSGEPTPHYSSSTVFTENENLRDSRPILIQAAPAFPLHRVAVQLHERSNSWAFLSLTDLPSDTAKSAQSLRDLGGITLFIPDFLCLSPEEQEAIIQYLSEPTGEGPRLIAGITSNPLLAVQRGQLSQALLDRFVLSVLRWTDADAAEADSDLIRMSVSHILAEIRDTTLNAGSAKTYFLALNAKFKNSSPATLH